MTTPRVAEPQSFCEQCGARLAAGIRFCETCGLAIDGPAPPIAMPAAVPAAVAVPERAPPPQSPSAGPVRTAILAVACLVLVALGGWWWWTRTTARDVATSRAVPAVATDATPTMPPVVDSTDVQYRDVKARFDRAYGEYTRLISTGGEGNVQVALQEYRAAYAELQRLDSLRKGRAP